MSLRHALLGQLAGRPASGYDLTKRFDYSTGLVWSAKHTQIYPELLKMAEAGLVTQGAEGPRSRREYTITDAGMAELRRWLLEKRPVHTTRNETMLQAMSLWVLDPADALAYFEREAGIYRAALARLQSYDDTQAWDGSARDRFGRIVLKGGLRELEGLAVWAEWAAEQVRETPGE